VERAFLLKTRGELDNGSESDWLPHGEAVFRIDLGAVYPGVEVRSLTE
jgi:hypothetical protein